MPRLQELCSWTREHRLRSCAARTSVVFSNQGSKPRFLHWQALSLFPGPPGKSSLTILARPRASSCGGRPALSGARTGAEILIQSSRETPGAIGAKATEDLAGRLSGELKSTGVLLVPLKSSLPRLRLCISNGLSRPHYSPVMSALQLLLGGHLWSRAMQTAHCK